MDVFEAWHELRLGNKLTCEGWSSTDYIYMDGSTQDILDEYNNSVDATTIFVNLDADWRIVMED